MFAQIIKALRLKNGMKQDEFAEKLGVKRSTVSKWESGTSTPTMAMLTKIAEMFGLGYDILMGKNMTDEEDVAIPVLGEVRAGIPAEAIENIIGTEYIPSEMAKTGEYFALTVKGDSMSPRIMEGDVLIVRKQNDVNDGDIAIVIVGNEEATVKKVIKHIDGITITAINPAYRPRFFSNKDIINLPVEILGKVVELRSRF